VAGQCLVCRGVPKVPSMHSLRELLAVPGDVRSRPRATTGGHHMSGSSRGRRSHDQIGTGEHDWRYPTRRAVNKDDACIDFLVLTKNTAT
jgi:hypothetical protein